ncbi:hypothetical protein PRZ48_006673 [Zasmidium cellare]|uniref:Uncharacterized protein n=1 Tax=Zasmidium cellare TaxID=395010 RepID=A0ABR0EPR8_ZASCE|nr:hypothetical protein PRZ48_006673 [Zasmidium cellare]
MCNVKDVLALMLPVCLASSHPADERHFQATTIVTNANNHSEFQCWQLQTPVGSIGGIVDTFNFNTTNAQYVVYPPRLNSGVHTAPTKVSLDEFWIVGGGQGTIISLDTEGSGHITDFPTDLSTVGFQIPLTNIPEHEVVGKGPCHFGSDGGTQLV